MKWKIKKRKMRLFTSFNKKVLEKQFQKISYSQTGEDIIVDFLFNNLFSKRKGVFLDIGAYHPIYLNNTYLFYLQGWRGFNIDPIQEHIDQFNLIRPEDNNICIAVGDTTEVKDFYNFDPDTISTVDKKCAEELESMGYEIKSIEKIQFLSVNDLKNSFLIPSEIDLLSLDVEGVEQTIITDILYSGIKPKVLIIETAEHSPNILFAKKRCNFINNICELGFEIYADTLINTIFISTQLRKTIKSTNNFD